ncbi:MAG: sugar transferase [Planctomycetota bacterium]
MSFLRHTWKLAAFALELASDVLGIILSFMVSHVLYGTMVGTAQRPFADKLDVHLVVMIVVLGVFFLHDLYRKHKTILNIEETRLILKSLIIAGLLTFAGLFFLEEARQESLDRNAPLLGSLHAWLASREFHLQVSRLEMSMALALMFPLVGLLRYGVFKLQQTLHLKGFGNERVLIYGRGELARRLRDKILQSPKSGYFLVGLINDDGSELDQVRRLGSFSDIERLCASFEIDRLVVADEGATPERLVELLRLSQDLRLQLEFVPALHALFAHRIRLSDVDGLPLITVKDLAASPLHRALKRLFDLVLGTLLFILLLPLLALIALWVKLDSPGPVLFRQRRTGLGGREFTMLKFRSMRVEAPAYALTPTTSDDPRITKAGRILRRLSLDEFPQLVNVLRGEMSLVGPRPEMPFITERYTPQQRERLRVKPGLTGLWQISADRRLSIHENLDYDLYYIEHQSMLLDFVILIRTAYSVVRGIGAW